MGAHPEARATHLMQYALMGAAYASVFHQLDRPRVGLLSNGTESIKGTEPLREAHRLLVQSTLDYQGFVESRAVPFGSVDVLVTDGFVGNITLKLCEGVVQSLFERIKDAVNAHWMARITGPALRRALNPLIRTLDWERVGAAHYWDSTVWHSLHMAVRRLNPSQMQSPRPANVPTVIFSNLSARH